MKGQVLGHQGVDGKNNKIDHKETEREDLD
jgi:hypothetical protein